MAKYDFARMGPDRFEDLAKALINATFRTTGTLIVFSDGPDGGREATWSQPPAHHDYVQPQGSSDLSHREWVFQAKHHAPPSRQDAVAEIVAADIRDELTKLLERHTVRCHSYVMITNLTLTGVRQRGSRDKISAMCDSWKSHIENIQVWDACDLAAMLDTHPEVRRTYLDFVLPSDLLSVMLQKFEGPRRMVQQSLAGYLHALMEADNSGARARTSEAGDESERPLLLKDVYVDLSLSSIASPGDAGALIDVALTPVGRYRPTNPDLQAHDNDVDSVLVDARDEVPASLAILLPRNRTTLLLAGPGAGKSTLCQFAALYHASRLVDPQLAPMLAALKQRIRLPEEVSYGAIDAKVRARVPFRIELRRYASWLADRQSDRGIATYIADGLIRPLVDCSINAEDVLDICSNNPTLLILDGLDEVPHQETRSEILSHLRAFVRRCDAAAVDLQVLLSSRPQGYNGEFLAMEPATWQINNLDPGTFWRFCDAWLDQRVQDSSERDDARRRLAEAMTSSDVKQLATTILQTTVMLSIARSRRDIPYERTSLFRRFVEVVFEREREKSPHVRRYQDELRRLHSDVAFSIHKSMEQTGQDGLAEDEFRRLALGIWESIHGSAVTDEPVTESVDAIIVAARDRLVLLRGQGEHELQVGFLLPSYREYFAADYLRSHEKADAHGVLEALLAREGHWENVLRFYAGVQSPSVHCDWIDYLMTAPANPSVDALLGTIRRRRLLLKLLPEFREVSRPPLQEGLRCVLAEDTIWTWAGEDWSPWILRNIRGGTLASEAVNLLLPLLESSDVQTFRGALGLALGIQGQVSTASDVVGCLRRRAEDGIMRPWIVQATLLGQCHPLIEELKHDDIWPPGTRVAIDVSEALQIESWVAGGMPMSYDIETRRNSTADTSTERHIDLGDGVEAWLTLGLVSPDSLLPKPAPSIGDLREPALSLYRLADAALSNPHDRQANDMAVDAFKPLRSRMSSELARVLVPLKSQFPSQEAWEAHWEARSAFLTDAHRASSVVMTIRPFQQDGLVTGYSENWLLAFVRPVVWPALVERGLVAREHLDRNRGSRLAAFLDTSLRHVDVIQVYGAVPRLTQAALVMIFRLAIENPRRVGGRPWMLLDSLSAIDQLDSAHSDAVCSAFDRMTEQGGLPYAWLSFVSLMLVSAGEAGAERALRLLEGRRGSSIYFFSRQVRRSPGFHRVRDWLAQQSSEPADDLVVAMSESSDLPHSEVARASLLRSAHDLSRPARRAEAVRLLFREPIRREELACVVDRVWWNGLELDPIVNDCERWLIGSESKLSSDETVEMLSRVVEQRSVMPPQIVSAALTRLVAHYRRAEGMLEARDWQKVARN